ncbi:hypothetical protein OROGR_018599 [Orobanche gracilis]
MRVDCPKYPGFCIARQKKEYPFIEIFHSPEQHFQNNADTMRHRECLRSGASAFRSTFCCRS